MRSEEHAGGYGTRLRPLTNKTPKPLLELAGKPIIEWQIEWLAKNGADSFVIGIGYLKHKIRDYFKGADLDIEFIAEDEPLGTGGAIKNAELLLAKEKEFIAVNGDIISSLSPRRLSLHENDIVSMALVPLKSPYGVIKTKGSRVAEFREKPLLKGYWLNAGVYKISNKIFGMLPEKGSLEELFQKLAQKNRMGCTKFPDVYWRSVDSLKDMEEADEALKSGAVY
ncbi:nucleotidyltransferase family protein [Candidatus Marsarchaeota archaeon]|nr:nucleotidyltransferase family protein [Candidatus Marsarchaeota archaeon]